MSKNPTMPAMMDMLMLNPTLALSSLHNLAKLAPLSLLNTLDIVPGQMEDDNALDNSWSPRLGTPERAPAPLWTRQGSASPGAPRPPLPFLLMHA
jgi:hypothetical protein